jgi:hypothetical protein
MSARPQHQEAVEVHPWRDGLWRWRYRNPADGVALSSNQSYASWGEAARAAAVSYPGVPVIDSRGAAGSRVGMAVSGLTVAAILAAALIAVAGLFALAAILLRWGLRRAVGRKRRRRR